MRVTGKYLINFVNESFKKLEINDVECHSVDRTYFTEDQYQNGACFLQIRFRKKDNHNNFGSFHCFFSMGEIQNHLISGKYELFLDFSKGRYNAISLQDIELNIRKK